MTHIDEGSLQSYLDGELHLEDRWRAERHLEACSVCRAELAVMQDRSAGFGGAMALLDQAPREGERAVGWPRTPRLAGARRMLPRAAVLLLFVGAAASATVPGSPVRRWIGEIASPPVEEQRRSTSSQDPAVAAVLEPSMESGVSVQAVDGKVEVVLRDVRDLSIRASLVEGTRAGVYAAGEAASAPFRASSGRIEVVDAQSGELRIEVPRGAATATVIINGRLVLSRQDVGYDIDAPTPEMDSLGISFSVDF